MTSDALALAKLDNAILALSEARTLGEVKSILDVAEAAKVYAKKAKLEIEAQNYAAEVALWSQRRAGEMLAQLERGHHADTGSNGQYRASNVGHSVSEYSAALREADVTRQDAHRWQVVASVPEQELRTYIADAKDNGRELTTTGALRLAKALQRSEDGAKRREQEFPTGIYSVIYADPPWAYNNSGFDQSAASQYPTMPTADICALPVGDICDESCVLFLWVTSPLLPDGLRVMQAWGFDYKASLIWVKNRAPGLGWWVSTYHELILVGCKGNAMHPDWKPDSVFTDNVGAHSAKPAQVYDMIERMYPGLPRVELFARVGHPGWSHWGNEDV